MNLGWLAIRRNRRARAVLGSLLLSLALGHSAALHGQEAATVRGTVTGPDGQPLSGVQISIPALEVGTLSGADGSYTVTVPAARLEGPQTVTIQARLIGYRTLENEVSLAPGRTVTQSFTLEVEPLQLEELVATGQGTQRERRRIGATINTISSEQVVNSQENNVVAALAGKAPNVEVTSSSGEPGGGAYIRIRGANTLTGSNQPLFVVDGTPISNASNHTEEDIWGTAQQNRAADVNPEDIESIEILKGAAASAIYGAAGANGAVLISTKSGARNAATQLTLKLSSGFDEVTGTPPLQRSFGRVPGGVTSWGEPVSGQAFDHSDEVFDTGFRFSGDATLSGGSDRTTYYLSGGWERNNSYFIGPNSGLDKLTTRLKGSQMLLDNLTLSGNFAYTKQEGALIQQGSNTSGIMLSAWRTPPDFDNCPDRPDGDVPCYLDPETGLHISYRCQPGDCLQGDFFNRSTSRGYDNPFWVAHEMPNTTDVDRTFGNIRTDWDPFGWLNVQYTLGADYYTDGRLTVIPKSSSDFSDGRMIRADFTEFNVDHSLLATGTREFSEDLSGSLTLGQNLRHEEFKQFLVEGHTLIFGTDELDFAVQRTPNEFKSEIRTAGYFANANLDLYDQLFLGGGVRFDASSTFGGEDATYYAFPNATLAWEFTQLPAFRDIGWLNYGKLRGAFGIAGKEPPVFSNVSAFKTTTLTDGWIAVGLETIYLGNEGVVSQDSLGNEDIEPERTREVEVGLELATLDSRVNLGLTYYDQQTTDAILFLPIPPSSGALTKPQNGAEYSNWGWEATLDVTPLQMEELRWDIGLQWGKNDSRVDDLLAGENFFLAGFAGSEVSVVEDLCGATADQECPFGVLFGSDFVRFGRGITVDGVNIDEAFTGWRPGDLYVAADGRPLQDARERVLGDPNPDWTGSVRSSLTFFNNLRVSGLLDIKKGGDMWNGTKGALFHFGTHGFTEAMHGDGVEHVFGCGSEAAGRGPAMGEFSVCSDPRGVAGPGAGTTTVLDAAWVSPGIGGGFTGPSSQFIEDAGFVKLRDISVSYTFDQDWVRRIGGASRIEVQAAARNIKTWTDYSGIDPESNLVGQDTGRGLDYFNNPQSRSFVFTVTYVR